MRFKRRAASPRKDAEDRKLLNNIGIAFRQRIIEITSPDPTLKLDSADVVFQRKRVAKKRSFDSSEISRGVQYKTPTDVSEKLSRSHRAPRRKHVAVGRAKSCVQSFDRPWMAAAV